MVKNTLKLRKNMIQFHFCETFIEKIKNQSFEEAIKQRILENSNRNELRDKGTVIAFGNIYVFRTNTPQTRTIIQKEKISGKNVYFVRDIIFGNNFDHHFGKVVLPQIRNNEWLDKYPLSEKDIENYEKEAKKSKDQKDYTLEKPPQNITSWLQDYSFNLKYDIFEMESWVKYASADSELDGMRDIDVKTFAALLNEIISNENNVFKEKIKEQDNIVLFEARKYEIGIVYFVVKITDKYYYVLYSGGHLEKQSRHWKNALKHVKNMEIPDISTINGIRKYAYKAYPKWTVANYEKWFAIQKNHELSNLSLTTEQLDFFDNYRFPCYINGQAGSGKSTMLYYLFANTYWYKCYEEIPGDIIFLTENESLLESTKQTVFDLLSNNPEFNDLNVEDRTEVNKHFASFKEFLYNQLQDEDKDCFDKNKYLSFATFKTLYENSYVEDYKKSRYTAEESWFTITNYIFGYEFGEEITDYGYYNNKDIINKIPKEIFDGIIENVLPYYKKLIEEDGYWDKLKIIKYIRNNIGIKKKYSVVICDEAQDFCRVELNFILHLSEFLDYDLSETQYVPVIFAGDPNQTVNPSGFREREMNDMLYKELKKVNFDYKKDESVYNPKYNFRSAQPIISLANFIQYYRKKQFDVRMVEPQIPKKPEAIEGKNHNFFYSFSDLLSNTKLENNLKDIIKYKRFIVPVDSNEKERFRTENRFLSLIKDADLKTAIESKGAEYEQVVLVGFGEYYLKHFQSITDTDEKTEFSRRYFFNKLYVGITRAQNELIIIDSEESQAMVWEKLVNQAQVKELAWREQLNESKDEVIIYDAESVSNLIQSTPETALENAKRDKEQGIIDQNASRLKLAGDQFFKFGNKEEGYNCYALAHEIVLNYEKAGKYYLKNNDIEKATTAYFKGELFDIINENATLKGKSVKADLQIILAQLMLGNELKSLDIETLYKQRQTLHGITNEITWRNKLINALIKDAEIDRSNEQQRSLIDILETIANNNDFELWKKIADKHFKLRYFERAIEIWKKIELIDIEKYTRARIELARINNNVEEELIWLGELIKYKENRKEIENIERNILDIYENSESEDIQNHYYYLPVYHVLLIHKPKNNIEKVGRIVEKLFEGELDNISNFYFKILDDKRLNEKVAEYIIERLAKTKYKHNNQTEEWLSDFNQQYKIISEKTGIPFNKFTPDDIIEIPDLPEKIQWHPPNRLANITIRNFRCFTELQLNDLGNYNLIVGDNNVGKTSLLEALLFYPDAKKALKEFALAHTERTKLRRYLDENRKEQFKIPPGFIDDLLNSQAKDRQIQFILQEKRAKWKFLIRRAAKNDFDEKYGINFSDFVAFESQLNKELIELEVFLKNIKPEDLFLCPYIPFGKGFDRELAQVYFNEIDKKKSTRKAFIENMKIFIPKIERILANPETGEIIIEEEDKEESSPLHQYGEGANKLFRILLQMTLQSGNKILIDEIDAGIHHSRFKKFWEVMLKIAQKDKIQLFATTHNIECVKYFKEILQQNDYKEYQNQSRVITLENLTPNIIKAYTRRFGEFEYELDNDFEIRGGDL